MQLFEVMYTPTLRCNYSCSHCGQNRFISELDEFSCLLLAQKIFPYVNAQTNIIITGGEPFLRKDIKDFILYFDRQIGNNPKIHIITNGYFTNRVKDLLESISKPENISFSISIDAQEETHNAIRGHSEAYKRAMELLSYMSDRKINVFVNTVVQKDNLDELGKLRSTISNLDSKIVQNFIPKLEDISKERVFDFSNSEVFLQFPYIDDKKDIKYLLSKGDMRLADCHAGMQNILLAPDGGVYTCITGFCYFSNCVENNYFLGDLKKETLADILANENAVGRNTVLGCRGCNSPCEWQREQKYFGRKIEFTESECKVLKELISRSNSMRWQWFQGWHNAEIYEWGEMHWMSSNSAKIFWKITAPSAMQLNITYCNSMPDVAFTTPMTILLSIENEEVFHNFVLDKQGVLKILLAKPYKQGEAIEIDVTVNHLWRPCDYDGGSDNRDLGIAICSIELI